ncbi:MAG: hypothetical protein ACRDXX_22445 [Stackebrandtia sp.]
MDEKPLVTVEDVWRLEAGESIAAGGVELTPSHLLLVTTPYDFDAAGKLKASTAAGIAESLTAIAQHRIEGRRRIEGWSAAS